MPQCDVLRTYLEIRQQHLQARSQLPVPYVRARFAQGILEKLYKYFAQPSFGRFEAVSRLFWAPEDIKLCVDFARAKKVRKPLCDTGHLR